MKQKIQYVCRECGATSPKWSGKCYQCGAWDSLVEEVAADPRRSAKVKTVAVNSKIVRLNELDTTAEIRMKTDIEELDRVLGGGIIPGSIILVGGDPGIGKSTLMLQMCSGLGVYSPLYITGEESLQQIKYRSERLAGIPEDLMLMSETNIETINTAILASDCQLAIVDSIQSVYSDRIDATPGSVAQVRESAALLMQTAKQSGKPIFLIGHVTKEGVIAGPKILEHLVDTVLQFEGDKTYSYRILRSQKNRYGSTNEIGIFDMDESGLREVKNPSEFFLAKRRHDDSGVGIVAAIEGSRPILLEVQALVSPSGYAVPQRATTGFDARRLNMLLAVLEKRLGEKLRAQDVFVNIAGGVYMNDPSVDLGLAAALVSSLRDVPLDPKTVIVGEIGLTGEVRPVSQIDQRIHEAEKLGFERMLVPALNMRKLTGKYSIEIVPVERLSLAFAKLF